MARRATARIFCRLLIEIYRDTKAIFKANIVDVFTKGTGGEEFSYYKAHGLEKVIDDIGEVLHSQYTITYTPNNLTESRLPPDRGGRAK